MSPKEKGPGWNTRAPWAHLDCNKTSVGLASEEGRDIKMVVALWRRGNRCRAAMDVQTLRCRAFCVLRYRLVIRGHLLGDGTLPLAVGQRRHRRPGGPGPDRRLALFVAAAQADIGEALQQRELGLLRVLFLGVAAGLPDFGLRRHREILELGHPRRAGRRTFGRLRNAGFGSR